MPARNTGPRRTSRQSNARKSRPNRQAEIAARVRAAQTHEDVNAVGDIRHEDDVPDVFEPDAPEVRQRRSGLNQTRRGVKRPSVARTPGMQGRRLTREQEYSFIRADLKRLLVTAGSLAVLMIVLLFVIEM